MKITAVEPIPVDRYLFVKVHTDAGITGLGESGTWGYLEASQAVMEKYARYLVGQDPLRIEHHWQYMYRYSHFRGAAIMGALSAIDIALWDIKGKALGVPLWNLLGGKLRDSVRAYPHASTPERARELVERGYNALKTGGLDQPVAKVDALRKEVGPDVDLMIDIHGPTWLTTRDAIRLGKALEPYDLLFYEDPVAPENIEAIARVAQNVDIPIAAGERHWYIYGLRQLIEREIVDVIQPDTGRAGGLMQMKKMAAMAEAHYITMAPHDGSLGPVAEMAAVHLVSTLPNFLILEHLEDDVPQRYEVMEPQPVIKQGHILVPDRPGIGVDIVEKAIAKYPSTGNVAPVYARDEFVYFKAREHRKRWLSR